MLRIFRAERLPDSAPHAEQREEGTRVQQTGGHSNAASDQRATAGDQRATTSDQPVTTSAQANADVSRADTTISRPDPNARYQANTQDFAAAAPDGPASTEAKDAEPGFLDRGRMRRRARFLGVARELAYRDLGGLVFDLHRFGQRNDEVVKAKLDTLAHIDAELRTLQRALQERQPVSVLREAGVAACPRCAAIHGSGDRFCPACGLAFDQSARPIASANAAHNAMPATPPAYAAPPAHATAPTPTAPPPSHPSLAPSPPAHPAPSAPGSSAPSPSSDASSPTEVISPRQGNEAQAQRTAAFGAISPLARPAQSEHGSGQDRR